MSVPISNVIYIKFESKEQKIVDAVMKRFSTYRDFCDAIGIELAGKCKPAHKAKRLKNGLDGFKPYQWERLIKIWYKIPLEQRSLYLRGVM